MMNDVQMDYTQFVKEKEREWQEQMNSKPAQWTVSDGLSSKIKEDGTMNDFYGYTTVIPLREADQMRCQQAQQLLLDRLPHRLVQLLPETFHLTIHALSNERNTAGGVGKVQEQMSQHESQVKQVFREVAERYAGRHINMRALGVSTNTRDVVSIKYVPEDSDDYALLMELHERIRELSPERGTYMPHVSLCYFRLDGLQPSDIDVLYQTMDEINRSIKLDIVLDVNRFVYQMHRHMNDFPALCTVQEFVAP
ncbi:2'-5' RNA ligase family protein [Paenibacillus kandeliae]|uniref:2'-5' RNA ligase family protein n=1 Tax=Paenibacillus kandeliae TaxID=3231269 RepID=UPI0034582ECE